MWCHHNQWGMFVPYLNTFKQLWPFLRSILLINMVTDALQIRTMSCSKTVVDAFSAAGDGSIPLCKQLCFCLFLFFMFFFIAVQGRTDFTTLPLDNIWHKVCSQAVGGDRGPPLSHSPENPSILNNGVHFICRAEMMRAEFTMEEGRPARCGAV